MLSIWEVAFIAALGLALEVVFTAVFNSGAHGKRAHLLGYSSIWYLPMYAVTPFVLHGLQRYAPAFFSWHWTLRGLCYMAFIYAFEGAIMLTLRRVLGSSPSEREYYASGRSFRGLVRYDFAPVWFTAGLLFEQAHVALHHLGAWH
jgi:hypothetical protein